MSAFYIYNTTTGEIVGDKYSNRDIIVEDSEEFKHVKLDDNVVTIYNIQKKYHDLLTNSLQDRPIINCPDTFSVTTTENIIISDLPNSTQILLDQQEIAIVTDGTLELTIPVSGTYALKLVPDFPYFEKTISVEVT